MATDIKKYKQSPINPNASILDTSYLFNKTQGTENTSPISLNPVEVNKPAENLNTGSTGGYKTLFDYYKSKGQGLPD